MTEILLLEIYTNIHGVLVTFVEVAFPTAFYETN